MPLDSNGRFGWIDGPVELKGEVDLAQLFDRLPNTLSLRADTRIRSGRAEIELRSTGVGESQAWEGRLTTRGLIAERDGRRIPWEEPIRASFKARTADRGLILDVAEVRSEFLRVTASGDRGQVKGVAHFDLNGLRQRLAPLVEWCPKELTGSGQLEFVGHDLGTDSARFDIEGRGGPLQVTRHTALGNWHGRAHVRSGQGPWQFDDVMVATDEVRGRFGSFDVQETNVELTGSA